MAGFSLPQGQKPDPPPGERRLEGWGEISAHLRRDIRTAQRWERQLALPVRRLRIGKLSSVYAYPSELDRWRQDRQPQIENEPDEPNTNGSSDAPPSENVTPNIVATVAELPDTPAVAKKFVRWAIGSGFFLVVAASAVYIGTVRDWWGTPRPGKVRVFVRPFTNNGSSSPQDDFIAGLTDETNTQLGRIDPSQLGVIAPTSSRLFAGKSIEQLKQLLQVQYVLEGSVRRSNNQVRIDAQLISVSDQTPIWSESYSNDLSDILRVQDEVARAVAQAIHNKIPGVGSDLPKSADAKRVDPEAYDAYLKGRRVYRANRHPEAYEAYLKGRFYWANRDLSQSVSAYELALTKDPEYTEARAGLASAYLLVSQAPNDVMPPNEAMPKAREAATRVLKANPSSSEAHCVLANIAANYDFNFGVAEREYQQAIRLDPTNSTAREWYGHYLITRHRMQEAQTATDTALDLDPVSPLLNSVRAETAFYARDYDATISQASRTLEQFPNNPYARFWLASAHREKKMFSEAIREFDELRKLGPFAPAMLMAYGHALAVSGDTAGGRKILADLNAMAESRYVPAIYFAAMHIGLGENDKAFRWLDKAYEERNDRLVYLAIDPLADPVRSDPRFRKLLNRIGLP